MAIFHYTIKIVGRSKGKSVISASAYLNGDVMKNEETGRISYYTSKKEVVYTSLMMCENAPPEWQIVPEENIKRFQKSVRYKRSEDKEATLEKFKITFQKQRLWNEVLKIEKNADAQLGRSFEFALPKEWNRQEQIQYTTDYIQKTFVWQGTGLPVKGNKKKADELLRQARRSFAPPAPTRTSDLSSDMLFSDYMLYWLKIIRSSVEQTTWSGYCFNVNNHIVPYFEPTGITLGGLQARHIQSFYLHELETLKATSVMDLPV